MYGELGQSKWNTVQYGATKEDRGKCNCRAWIKYGGSIETVSTNLSSAVERETCRQCKTKNTVGWPRCNQRQEKIYSCRTISTKMFQMKSRVPNFEWYFTLKSICQMSHDPKKKCRWNSRSSSRAGNGNILLVISLRQLSAERFYTVTRRLPWRS